jgi:hypothetical protein
MSGGAIDRLLIYVHLNNKDKFMNSYTLIP